MIEAFDLAAKSLMLNWGEFLVVTTPTRPYAPSHCKAGAY